MRSVRRSMGPWWEMSTAAQDAARVHVTNFADEGISSLLKVMTRDFGVCFRASGKEDFKVRPRSPKPRPEWLRALFISIHTRKIKVLRIQGSTGHSYDVTPLQLYKPMTQAPVSTMSRG